MNSLPLDNTAAPADSDPAAVIELPSHPTKVRSIRTGRRARTQASKNSAPTPAGRIYEKRVTFRVLFPSELNYRQDRDPDYIQELSHDIKAHGILQNLIARPAGNDRYEVFAGGTRYQGVTLLVEQGAWDPDEENIPIQVREGISDAELLLLSLSENNRRRDPHWLEEARGVRLALDALAGEAGPQRGDGLTALVAERLQMTQRWIQILTRLDRELHPELKAFFLANRSVPIDVAKAVCSVPADHQLPALEQLKASVAHGWRIVPENLKQLLVSRLPRAADAIFDRNLYDGRVAKVEVDVEPDIDEEWSEGEEDVDDLDNNPCASAPATRDVELLLDAETFTRLQEEAIAKLRDELAVQHPFVHILRTDNPWAAINQDYRRFPGHDEAGAVIVVTPDLRVTVETDLVPTASLAETGEGKPAQPAEPLTKAHLSKAHRMKSAAIQRRIADSPIDAARLAILGLLGYSSLCKLELAPISPEDRVIDLALLPALRLLKRHFGDLLELPALPETAESSSGMLEPDALPHFSFRSHDRGDAAQRAVRILVDLPVHEVQAIFCALVAVRAGSFCDYTPALGDRPATAAFAQAIGASVEDSFLEEGLTEQFLKGYRKPHLVRIAKACGVEAEDLDALTQKDLRGLILRSPGRLTFMPPELHFGPDSVLANELERVGQPQEPRKAKSSAKKKAPSAGPAGTSEEGGSASV